jgi:hypothetical protein
MLLRHVSVVDKGHEEGSMKRVSAFTVENDFLRKFMITINTVLLICRLAKKASKKCEGSKGDRGSLIGCK